MDEQEGRHRLRRIANSSPSLRLMSESSVKKNVEDTGGFPFPPSYDPSGASASGYYNPRPPRQRSRSEHSSETLLGPRESTGLRARIGTVGGAVTPDGEKSRGWVGRMVVGAAGRMGAR